MVGVAVVHVSAAFCSIIGVQCHSHWSCRKHSGAQGRGLRLQNFPWGLAVALGKDAGEGGLLQSSPTSFSDASQL